MTPRATGLRGVLAHDTSYRRGVPHASDPRPFDESRDPKPTHRDKPSLTASLMKRFTDPSPAGETSLTGPSCARMTSRAAPNQPAAAILHVRQPLRRATHTPGRATVTCQVHAIPSHEVNHRALHRRDFPTRPYADHARALPDHRDKSIRAASTQATCQVRPNEATHKETR